MRIWRSPSAARSVTARRLRPIRRWISWVRPLCRPRAASRSVRVWVERGSMPYSAVTQPFPVLRRNGGTRSSTVAMHSTCVSPNRARHEPSAYLAIPGSRLTGRSASEARPEGRISLSIEQAALADRRHRSAYRAARAAGDDADLAVVELELQGRVRPDLDRVGNNAASGRMHHDIAARQ